MEATAATPWAKLIPLSSATPTILLTDKTSSIGSLDGCSIRLAGNGIGGLHCSVSRVDELTSLLTAHVDGQVVLNDSLLAAQQKCNLYNGDRLILAKSALGDAQQSHSYIFTLLFDRLKRNTSDFCEQDKPLTRMITRDMLQATSSGEQMLERPEQQQLEADSDAPAPQQMKDEGITSELNCGICFELIHNCVSVIPCLHNFCGACISGWLDNDSCPLCKSKMTKLKKNATINSLIESVVRIDASKRRSATDLADMDSKDRFRLDQEVVLKREKRKSRYLDDEDLSDDAGSQTRERPCSECTTARQADGFRCLPDTLHLTCTSCRKMFPNRSDLFAQKCQICMNAYCSLYLGGCDGDIPMLRLRDHRPESRLNEGIFRSNLFELSVASPHQALRSFLASKALSTLDIFAHIMNTHVMRAGFSYKKDPSLYQNIFRTLASPSQRALDAPRRLAGLQLLLPRGLVPVRLRIRQRQARRVPRKPPQKAGLLVRHQLPHDAAQLIARLEALPRLSTVAL